MWFSKQSTIFTTLYLFEESIIGEEGEFSQSKEKKHCFFPPQMHSLISAFAREQAIQFCLADPSSPPLRLQKMPTYEDPGCFCKFCCSPCAVYQAQGCKCPEMILALWCGCYYTMCCWDPKAGAPVGGGPVDASMER